MNKEIIAENLHVSVGIAKSRLAEERLDILTVCFDCMHFDSSDLFSGYCNALNCNVEYDDKCECWQAENENIKGEIKMLIEILNQDVWMPDSEKTNVEDDSCTHPIEYLQAMHRSFYCRRCRKTII